VPTTAIRTEREGKDGLEKEKRRNEGEET